MADRQRRSFFRFTVRFDVTQAHRAQPSVCRDLTNAAWVAAKLNTRKDQTGFDGTPHSATSITAASENGTILQSIEDHEVVHRQHSAFVKRLSGSGAIQMTMDGGTNWANVTVANEWTRVNMPAQTIEHPVVGFRVLTKGDSIAVDCVQNEKLTSGVYALYANSSPIITNSTSVDRPADVVRITPTPSISSTAFSMDCEGAFLGQSSAPTVFPYLFNAVGENSLDDVAGFWTRNDIASWAGFGVRVSGSGNNAAIPPGSPLIKDRFAVAGAFSTIRSQTAANGFLGMPSGSNPPLNPVVSVGFGLPAHYQLPPFFYFGRVALWPSTTLTDDTLVAITAALRGSAS